MLDYQCIITDERSNITARGYVNQHNAASYKSQVWFTISERFGKFAMVILYDNVQNLLADRLAYTSSYTRSDEG